MHGWDGFFHVLAAHILFPQVHWSHFCPFVIIDKQWPKEPSYLVKEPSSVSMNGGLVHVDAKTTSPPSPPEEAIMVS